MLTSTSTIMDRAFAHRLLKGDMVINTLSRMRGVKDHTIDRITVLQPMAFNEGGSKDLAHPEAVNFNEPITDRREYNLSWRTTDREGSKVGGDSKYMEDWRNGISAGARVSEQIGHVVYNAFVSDSEVDEFQTSNMAFSRSADKDTTDQAVERLFLDVPTRLRAISGGANRKAMVNALLPFEIDPMIARFLSRRETNLGDATIEGMVKSDLFRVQYGTPASTPIEFTLDFSSNPSNGETLKIIDGSGYATVEFKTTLDAGTPNQVRIGSSAAATRANYINFLVDMDNPEGTANYGPRVQYDIKNPKKAYNLQQREVLFVAGDSNANASTKITVFGAPAGLKAEGTASGDISLSGQRYIALFTVDGPVAEHILRDEMKYGVVATEKNQSRKNHQIWGTYGVGFLLDSKIRTLKQGITITA